MVVPTPRVFPKCSKCGSGNITHESRKIKKVSAIIIFCGDCGSVMGVLNENEKK